MSASLPIVRDFAPTEMTQRCNRNVTPFPWPFGTKALPLPLQCWIACEKYDEVLPLKREKMKMRIKTPFLTVILALPVMVSCIGKDRVIDVAALPATAQRLLSSEFSAKQISFIKAERDFLTLDYDVVFSDGSAIEFNSKGQWEEVNCRLGDVPPRSRARSHQSVSCGKLSLGAYPTDRTSAPRLRGEAHQRAGAGV